MDPSLHPTGPGGHRTARQSLPARLLDRALDRLGVDSVDPLTGLDRPERLARCGPQVLAPAVEGQHCALLMLDLDHFKQINDTFGHDVGDRALAEIGQRIADCVLPEDLAVRLGGDEFAILTRPTTDTTCVVGLATRLIETISAPLHVEDLELTLSTSIGVALSTVDGETVEDLRRAADRAMYAAKQTGPGRWRLSSDPGEDAARSEQLLTALAEDPDSDQISVHYQPQVDALEGHVVGFEALARWEHPDLGTVLPHEFMPLAERSGLMPAVNRAVLRRALSDLPRLRDHAPGARLSLNISPRHLVSRGFVDDLRRRLAQYDVAPHEVTLEITELVTRGSTEQWEVLSDLHDAGVSVSVRGFGTTESALSALWSSPAISEVKLDPAFVRGAARDPESSRRLRATAGAARGLGLRVVAQGVEERCAATAVADLGCEVLQGFWIAEPADLESTLAWTRAWPSRAAERLAPPGSEGAGTPPEPKVRPSAPEITNDISPV